MYGKLSFIDIKGWEMGCKLSFIDIKEWGMGCMVS